MRKVISLLILLVILQGCLTVRTIDHYKNNYVQRAPMKYPETDEVMNFHYDNVDLESVYDLLFSDYLIIGSSDFFEKSVDDEEDSIPYAKSIGTDIFLSVTQYKESITYF